MKTRYLLLLASLVLATSAYAASAAPCDGHHHQGRHDGPPPPGAFIERLDERADLDLSDAQKQKLKAIGEEERSRHEAVRKEYQARLDAVLTLAQRARIEAHRKEVREQHAERLEKRAERMKERAGQIREHKDAVAR